MTQYLITFGFHAMDHIPEAEMADVGKAANEVVEQIKEAGVFVCAGGVRDESRTIVATDGAVSDGQLPDAIGGMTIVDVPSRAEALEWAAKIAVACRCPQEVYELA